MAAKVGSVFGGIALSLATLSFGAAYGAQAEVPVTNGTQPFDPSQAFIVKHHFKMLSTHPAAHCNEHDHLSSVVGCQQQIRLYDAGLRNLRFELQSGIPVADVSAERAEIERERAAATILMRKFEGGPGSYGREPADRASN